MRRIVVIGTALAVLLAAATAYAASSGLNTYSAKIGFSPNKAGSGKAPSAIGFTEHYKATGNNGNRTAPLTDIKTKIYGLLANGKDFPTCSQAKIAKAFSDSGCPKGALLATGAITAILGTTSDTSTSAPGQVPCDPILHAWNGGQGKVVYFFVDQAPNHTCGPLQTGGVGPFVGSAKMVGKVLVMDTPIPHNVSFPLGGIEGSLTSETLHFVKQTKTVKGKQVAAIASVACNKGKRPYSVTFTAEASDGSAPQSATVSGTSKCS